MVVDLKYLSRVRNEEFDGVGGDDSEESEHSFPLNIETGPHDHFEDGHRPWAFR